LTSKWFSNVRKSRTLHYGNEGAQLSKFTASVNLYVDSSEKENILAALSDIEGVEEVYDVTGEYDIVSIVSTNCMEDFHELLHKQILHIKGVKSTVVNVILNLHDKTLVNKEKFLTSIQKTIRER
jgi:DNA-binding Lrp family transcriptional regulator